MATGKVARLIASLELDAAKFAKGVKVATSEIDKLASKTGKIGSIASRGAAQAGRNIERGIVVGSVAAAGALTYAAEKALDWESAIAGVNKTVSATPAQLAAIEQGLRDLAKTMPVSATDLATIAENAGALGIAQDDIIEFTKVVAMIGATTNVSVEDASTALGQLQNVIGLTGDDFDNFAATLVDLGNKGASTEAQILEVARRAGGAANLFGLAKDETLAWASAAANLGLNEELAGTALQNLFIKSMPAFLQGNKTLETVTGKTAKQLKKAFKTDASGALEDFLKKLGKMPKDARLEAVQKIFGKGSGLTRLILGLADSMDTNLDPALENAATAWDKNTAATTEYEKRAATTASQLAILRNNIDDAAITIGSALLPVLADLSKEGVAWLTDHQQEIKDFGKQVGQGARDAVAWFKSIDWGKVTAAFGAGIGFAKGLLSTFLAMPSWVQTAVITGWGLNKLTGGALTGIVGELSKGLIKGVLGMNAGVVNAKAGVVNVSGPVTGTGTGTPTGPVVTGKPSAIGTITTVIAAGSIAELGYQITSAVQSAESEVFKGLFPDQSDMQRAFDLALKGNRDLFFPGFDTLHNLDKIPGQIDQFIAAINRAFGGEPNKPTPGGKTGTPASGVGFIEGLGKKITPVATAVEGVKAGVSDVKDEQVKAIAAIGQAKDATRVGAAATVAATNIARSSITTATYQGASTVASAVRQSRPIITTNVDVHVTAAQVTKSVSVQEHYGPGNGSAGGGGFGTGTHPQ